MCASAQSWAMVHTMQNEVLRLTRDPFPFPFGSFLVLDFSSSLFYPTHTLSYTLRAFTKSSIYSLNFCSYRNIMMLYSSFRPNNFSTFSRNVVNRQKRLPKCELKEEKKNSCVVCFLCLCYTDILVPILLQVAAIASPVRQLITLFQRFYINHVVSLATELLPCQYQRKNIACSAKDPSFIPLFA